ncbi:peptidoglycan-binding protein [Aestuariimicrobium soli]|uniref:peptidoglycan-binding protein n=1 Tax=Aestuariimicrobium soli TaxID=2035834 RepID=UPI003EBFDC45
MTTIISRRALLGGVTGLSVGVALAATTGAEAFAVQRQLSYTFHAQETTWSCSAAAAKMVLSARGINVSEATLRSAMGVTSSVGLPDTNNLVRALNSYAHTSAYSLRSWQVSNYAAVFDADVRRSIDNGFSVAMGSWYVNRGPNYTYRSGSGHFMTIMGYNDTHYLVADPASSLNGPGMWKPKSTVVSWRKTYYVAVVNVPAASAWPALSVGATGFRVRTLQYLLRSRGWTSLAADSSYGPATVSAVKAFQQRMGLVVDGAAGAKTWPVLVVAVSSGATGDAVRAAQVALNGQGAALALDGSFGPAQVAAVRAFQLRSGLVVDGVVGPRTWSALV